MTENAFKAYDALRSRLASLSPKQKRWLAGSLLLVVIVSAVTIYQNRSQENGKKVPPVVVSVATVKQQDMPLTLKEVGTVVPYEAVSLRSRIDSQVMEVKFRDGDTVHEGDLLFVLDDRTLKAQLAQLEANVKREKAQGYNLERQYLRDKELTSKGFESKANLDNAKAAYEAQKATIRSAEAELENTRVQLGYTRITAPITGRTGTINVTTGNTVKANDATPLVTINQIKPIRVQTTLPQSYFDAVKKAMSVNQALPITATRENSGVRSTGTLEYMDNNVNQSTGTFAVRAIFPNEDESLWPGMFVNLTLTLGEEKQVLTVPEVAIQRGQNETFVFVITDGKAQKRAAKVARVQDGLAIIAEGVSKGEQVVVDGVLQLKEGSEVAIKAAEKPTGS